MNIDKRYSLLFRRRTRGNKKGDAETDEIAVNTDEDMEEDIQENREEKLKLVGKRVTSLLAEDKDKLTVNERLCYHPEVLLAILEARTHLCPYCEIHLDARNLSLDRINNDKIHHAKNVILTCSPCNKARGDYFTVEEFILTCRGLTHARTKAVETFEIEFKNIKVPATLYELACKLDRTVIKRVFEAHLDRVEERIVKIMCPEFDKDHVISYLTQIKFGDYVRDQYFKRIVFAFYPQDQLSIARELVVVLESDETFASH